MIAAILPTALLAACATAGGAIVAAHLLMYVGLVLAAVKERRLIAATPARRLTTTVIVPARNEERLLPRLLDSLLSQTADDFHIVLVNDRSEDGTKSIMDRFASSRADRTTVIDVTEDLIPENGKLNALVHGARAADSELIVFTDADCVTPPGWIAGVQARYADSQLGVLIGPIETVATGKVLSAFHSFDHVFKYSYTAACTGVEMATGGFGNNLSIRRAVLERIGGLESLAVTVTEDAALIAAVRETAWTVRASFAREITVLTEPQKTWKDLTAQELRWHIGGVFSPDTRTRLSYRFIMFYLTVSVLVVPFVPFVRILAILPSISFLTMFLIAAGGGILTRQPLTTYWLPLIWYVLFSMGYNSYLTVRALLQRRVFWKGRLVKPRAPGT